VPIDTVSLLKSSYVRCQSYAIIFEAPYTHLLGPIALLHSFRYNKQDIVRTSLL